MPTQSKLIEGFVLQNNNVTVASNMKLRKSTDNEVVTYLCGGRSGRDAILAKREPLNHITIYIRSPYGTRMYPGDIRDQMATVENVVRRLAESNDITYETVREAVEPNEVPIEV